jgi:hypothetical protein
MRARILFLHSCRKVFSRMPRYFSLSPPAGGRGQAAPERPARPAVRGEGADERVSDAAHLTLPGAVAPGPLPLPLNP